MREAYEFLAKGGIIMVPILLSSVVALAIFLERLWALRREKIIPETFLQKATKLVYTRQFGEALALCERSEAPIARVLAGGLRHAGKERAFIKEVMEEVGRREAGALERGVNILATIANLAPLLGLLGTVTGMIQVFQGVVRQAQEVGGQVNVGNLAGGIWEALITTAAGLTVAIPVIVLHRILVGVVDRHLNEMEERSLELADSMTQEAASKAAVAVAGAEAEASGEARP